MDLVMLHEGLSSLIVPAVAWKAKEVSPLNGNSHLFPFCPGKPNHAVGLSTASPFSAVVVPVALLDFILGPMGTHEKFSMSGGRHPACILRSHCSGAGIGSHGVSGPRMLWWKLTSLKPKDPFLKPNNFRGKAVKVQGAHGHPRPVPKA